MFSLGWGWVQAFPAEDFMTTPAPAPDLGALGYSFFGENINGPLDAGFFDGQVQHPVVTDNRT